MVFGFYAVKNNSKLKLLLSLYRVWTKTYSLLISVLNQKLNLLDYFLIIFQIHVVKNILPIPTLEIITEYWLLQPANPVSQLVIYQTLNLKIHSYSKHVRIFRIF